MNWTLTQAALNRAASVSAQVRARIVNLLISAEVPSVHGTRWGQFLDAARDDSQYGVYGTAAAIEILTASGYLPGQPPISVALEGLPLIGGLGAGYEAVDNEIVFKVAALASVTQPDQNGDVPIFAPAVMRLLEMKANPKGWGHYLLADGTRDAHLSLTTTACVLYSLRRVISLRSDASFQAILDWVAEQLCAQSSDDVSDTLGLLALMAFARTGCQQSRWEEATQAATARILKRRSHWSASNIAKVDYHFATPTASGRNDHSYFFFLPDVVAALAFAEWKGRPREAGRLLTRITLAIISSSAATGFLAPGSGRLATVDQLWVHRLLAAFEREVKCEGQSLLPGVVGRASTRKGRTIAATLLAICGFAGLGVSLQAGMPWLFAALASGVSAIALGVLVSAIRPFDKR